MKSDVSDILEVVRDIDHAVGGKELAQMPVFIARLVVRLKARIQNNDARRVDEAMGIRDTSIEQEDKQ